MNSLASSERVILEGDGKMKKILYAAMSMLIFLVGCGGGSLTGPAEDNTNDLGQTGSNTVAVVDLSPNNNPPGIAPYDPVKDYTSLITRLQISGATVQSSGEVSQPFFSVTGQILSVNGASVQVFEYADGAAAKAEAGLVSPNGSAIGTSMVSWIDTPHFYAADCVSKTRTLGNLSIRHLVGAGWTEDFIVDDGFADGVVTKRQAAAFAF